MKQAAIILFPILLMAPKLSLTTPLPPSNERSQEANLSTHRSLSAESLYQLLVAEMALDRQEPELALANYSFAAKETQDADIAARATQVALTTASLGEALEPAKLWAKVDPKNLEAQITVAALYLRLKQAANAVPYLYAAEKQNPEEALAYYLLLFKQLKNEKEIALLIQALQMLSEEELKDKHVMSAHLALAEIYLHQGKNDSALQITQKAIQYIPTSVNAIQLHTEALLRAKEVNSAKNYLERVVAHTENNIPLQQYYAQFLIENGFEKQAHQAVEKIIQNPSLTSQELLQFSRLCMQAQWFDFAEILLHRASHFPESKDLSFYFLARVAEMQNHDDAATEWFKQVLTGPFHVLSQIRASVLLADAKKYDDALAVLSRTNPTEANDHKQVLLATIDVLNKAKRYSQCLSLLNDELKTMPDDIELHYARSLVADQLGKLDIAEKDLRDIIALQPNHLDALNTLGYLLTNKTNRLDEAKKYLSQALKLSPEDPSVLDSLGWLYYKMGDYPKSIEFLKKAASLTNDSEIASHLTEVLRSLGASKQPK